MHSVKRDQIEQALMKGKPYKEIASQYRVSFRDITRIAKEMREPSPFDIFHMVAEGKTPTEIAEETGAGFDEVKRIYGECVELLGKMNEHSKTLKELEGTQLYKRLMAVIKMKEGTESEDGGADSQKERELLAKALVGARYVCAECGSPLKEEDVRKLRPCPKCGRTNYKEV